MTIFSGPDFSFQAAALRRKITPLGWTWLVIATVIALDVLGMRWMPHPVELKVNPRVLGALCALMFAIGWIALRTQGNSHTSRWGKRLADLSFTAQWMAAFAAFVAAAAVLGYLSVETDFPLIDGVLVRLDNAVGFDWGTWYCWVQHHRAIFVVLSAAYGSGVVQATFVPLILGATGRRSEMIRHIARTMLATLVAIAISTPFPAASAFLHFHVVDPGTSSEVSSFFALRHGTLNAFDLANMQGLISMPSMHATMAVLFAWALRGVPRLAAPAVALNAIMILSTPSQGGHYLTDTATGLLLAWTTIRLVARMNIDA